MAESFTSPCGNESDPVPFGEAEVGEVLLGASTGIIHDIVTTDTHLYVCGIFDQVDGVAAHNIARWDGTTWEALHGLSGDPADEGLSYWGAADCVMTIGPLGKLFVAGTIDGVGIQPAVNIAAWDAGSGWQTLPTGGIANDPLQRVYSLASSPNLVEVGGWFTKDGAGNPLPHSGHARFDPFTWTWSYAVGSYYAPEIMSMHYWDAVGLLILGGHMNHPSASLTKNLFADAVGPDLFLEREVPQHVMSLVPAEIGSQDALAWSLRPNDPKPASSMVSVSYDPVHGPMYVPTPGMGFVDTNGYVGYLGTPTGEVYDFVYPSGPMWKPEALFAGGYFSDISGTTLSNIGWYQAPAVGGPTTWKSVDYAGASGAGGLVAALDEFAAPDWLAPLAVGECVWAGGQYTTMLGEPASSIGGFCCTGNGG